MADKKISELVSLAGKDVAATDFFPVVDVSVAETKSLTRDELRNAVNAIHFTATKALATTAAASLPDDTIIEVAADESLSGARTRYTVAAGALVFAYGVVTKADLADASDPAKGAALVGFLPAGTGAVARNARDKLREIVSAKDFGAVGDGVADDTAAIQAAIDHATLSGSAVYGVTGATYKISSPVYITCNFYFYSSFATVVGSTASAGFVVQANKTANTNALLMGKTIELPYITNLTAPATGWAGQGIGVVLNTLDSCIVKTNVILGFMVGLDVTANSGIAGTASNTIFLGRIVGNYINLRLKPNDAAAYVNENTFIGGKLGLFSSNPLGYSMVALLPYAGASNGPNANKFYGLNIEGSAGAGSSPDYHLVLGGAFNLFLGTRLEFTGGLARIRLYNIAPLNVTDNLFIGGYSFGGITFSKEGSGVVSGNIIKNIGRNTNIESVQATFASVFAGGSSPYLRLYPSTKDILSAAGADTDWSMQISGGGSVQTKNPTFHTTAAAQLAEGYLQFNNGTAAINLGPFITFVAANSVGTTTSLLQAGNLGAWNGGHLKIGPYHLWVTGTGSLLIKGSAPTSDTDGVVVGTEAAATLRPSLQTGTAYTLVLADAGKRVSMSNAAANVVTVPLNSSVAIPIDTRIFVSQDGAGATSIAGAVGVTINTAEGLKVGGQYKMVSLVKTATDTWMAIGTVA